MLRRHASGLSTLVGRWCNGKCGEGRGTSLAVKCVLILVSGLRLANVACQWLFLWVASAIDVFGITVIYYFDFLRLFLAFTTK
jgi:hypothetical protein